MSEKIRSFYKYRALINLGEQLSLSEINYLNAREHQLSRIEKKRKLKYVYEKIKNTRRMELKRGETQRYYLLANKEIKEDILLCQLAKAYEEPKYDLENDRISESMFYNYPFVYVLFCLQPQSFLIERKTTVFQDVNTAKNVLEDILIAALQSNNASVSLLPITSEVEFWNSLDEFDYISEVTLNMNSPNLFLGSASAEEALADMKEVFNNDSVEITAKSTTNGISVDRSRLEQFIHYIRSGGGFWKIRGSIKSKPILRQSRDSVQCLHVQIDDVINGRNTALQQIEEATQIYDQRDT